MMPKLARYTNILLLVAGFLTVSTIADAEIFYKKRKNFEAEFADKTYSGSVSIGYNAIPKRVKFYLGARNKSWVESNYPVSQPNGKISWGRRYYRSSWRVKQFPSKKTVALCYDRYLCIDIQKLKRMKIGNGDSLALRKKVEENGNRKF